MYACLAPRAVSMIVAEQSSPTIHAQTAVIRSANKDSSQLLVATMPASAFAGLPCPRVFSAEHFADGDVQRSKREEKDSSTVSPSIPSTFLSSTTVTQQTIQLCDTNQGQVVNTRFWPYVTNCYEALSRTISASNTSNPGHHGLSSLLNSLHATQKLAIFLHEVPRLLRQCACPALQKILSGVRSHLARSRRQILPIKAVLLLSTQDKQKVRSVLC